MTNSHRFCMKLVATFPTSPDLRSDPAEPTEEEILAYWRGEKLAAILPA